MRCLIGRHCCNGIPSKSTSTESSFFVLVLIRNIRPTCVVPKRIFFRSQQQQFTSQQTGTVSTLTLHSPYLHRTLTRLQYDTRVTVQGDKLTTRRAFSCGRKQSSCGCSWPESQLTHQPAKTPNCDTAAPRLEVATSAPGQCHLLPRVFRKRGDGNMEQVSWTDRRTMQKR